MYICNRKQCDHCAKDCHYTSDINYALYDTHTSFYPDGEYVWERPRK